MSEEELIIQNMSSTLEEMCDALSNSPFSKTSDENLFSNKNETIFSMPDRFAYFEFNRKIYFSIESNSFRGKMFSLDRLTDVLLLQRKDGNLISDRIQMFEA